MAKENNNTDEGHCFWTSFTQNMKYHLHIYVHLYNFIFDSVSSNTTPTEDLSVTNKKHLTLSVHILGETVSVLLFGFYLAESTVIYVPLLHKK